jgi:hypothetical protein
MALPSELCMWCRNLVGNDENAKCIRGKNPFRWVITCDSYSPNGRRAKE